LTLLGRAVLSVEFGRQFLRARAWQLLESVPLDELDDDTGSRVLTALEQLDSAVRGAVADGRLSTDSVDGE